MSQPIARTLAETYLRNRGITALHEAGSLRFHPRCYYRPDEQLPTETWPAMIACVTDLDGRITGVHRTWLDPDGFDRVRLGKAPIDTPRRAMGDLLGNAVRFGVAETTCLSPAKASRPCCRYAACFRPCRWPLRCRPITSRPWCFRRRCVGSISPATPMPPATRRQAALTQRAEAAGIEAIALSPRLGDFNEDLHIFGLDALRAALRIQLAPEDVVRFLLLATTRRMSAFGCHRRSIAGRGGPHAGQRRDHGLLEGDRTAGGPGRQWLRPAIFRRP